MHYSWVEIEPYHLTTFKHLPLGIIQEWHNLQIFTTKHILSSPVGFNKPLWKNHNHFLTFINISTGGRKKQKANGARKEIELHAINLEEKECANGHDITLIDPSYNKYSMNYYHSLRGDITCVKVKCKNKGLTLGELVKKNITVHVCKRCEIYEGSAKFSYMMYNTCKVMEEDGSGR